MSIANRFNCFALDLGKGIHKLNTDTLKVYLTNTAPDVAANLVYGDVPDLGTGGGYTAGGLSVGVNTWSQAAGLASLILGGNLLWTATTGFGPLRYAVLYNFSAAAKNLIGYWDYSQAVTIGAGKTFEVDFASPAFTLNITG